MLKTLKLWWKVRKLKKALLKQVEIEKLDDRRYVAQRLSYWKKKNIYTLRHATGGPKYTT